MTASPVAMPIPVALGIDGFTCFKTPDSVFDREAAIRFPSF
jgi:hypothetical protein